MGFDCFQEVDLRISNYVRADLESDSLVNNQILREIEACLNESVHYQLRNNSISRFFNIRKFASSLFLKGWLIVDD